MKTRISLFLVVTGLAANSTFGQTAPKPHPSGNSGQRMYSPAYGEQQGTSSGQNQNQNQTPVGTSLSFSNSAGQVFTVRELADNLRNLNDAVVRTMPALTAFNDAVTGSGANQTLAGAISNLVSGALNKNASQSNMPPSQGTAMVNALAAELRSQEEAQAAANPDLSKDLVRLRNDLQPVTPLLQNLVQTTPVNQPPDQVISRPQGTNAYQRPVTPTGRGNP